MNALVAAAGLIMLINGGVPDVHAVALPHNCVSFQVRGNEVAAYHYESEVPRPYIFPVIGPGGSNLTSLMHPFDPHGHRHHRSVWIAHHDINGANFWADGKGTHVVTKKVDRFTSGPESAELTLVNLWMAGNKSLLKENRIVRLTRLENGEFYIDIDMTFSPIEESVTLGITPFGFLGVRMAPHLAVKGGKGRVLNSDGLVNEEEVFWKRAKWVDYSGPVSENEHNGIAIFDHPNNPSFPTHWHVRNDGWMGASLTHDTAYVLAENTSLLLKYRLFIHGNDCSQKYMEEHWRKYGH